MKLDLKKHLMEMISAPGPSGFEAPIREIIQTAWEPYADETRVNNLGSLVAIQRGEGAEPRPSVMIAAHMDAIGLMVTGIDNGFLRFTQVGGVDPRILPGQMVTVHATNAGATRALPATVVMPPAFLLPKDGKTGILPQKYLLADTGLEPDEVRKLVRVGDVISFATEPVELNSECISGHTLDNRASVAAVTVALAMLSKRKHLWDVMAVATAQEEVGGIGAMVDAVAIKPDFAIVIDVTFAKAPGGAGIGNFELGKVTPLTWGSCNHPALHQAMVDIAEEFEINVAKELAPKGSWTDAWDIQVAEAGVPVAELAIPLRYMHTPVEVVSLKDVRRAGRLMAEFIAGLPLDFMKTVIWE